MMPGMTENVRRIARMPLPGDNTPDLPPIQRDIREYLNTRTLREKTLVDENKRKAALMEVLEHEGRVEGNGHRFLDLDEPWPLTMGEKHKMIKAIKRERKVTQNFDADAAMDLLKAKSLVDDCTTTETIVYVDEDKVLAANYEGKITDDELKALYSNSESFSCVPVEA